MDSHVVARPVASRSLDVQLAEFRARRFLAMPLAGALVWTLIGVGGAFLSPVQAIWTLFIGTGSIAYLGMFISRFTGEDFLDRSRPKNAFDTLFFMGVFQALLVFAIAIPFFRVDYTSLPMTVGILTGLMWVPVSWLLDHWVGLFHATVRTGGAVAVWYLLPGQRFVAIPVLIVAVYLVTMGVLEARYRRLSRTGGGGHG